MLWCLAHTRPTLLQHPLTLTQVLKMDYPFHKLFRIQPNYSKIRVYGCLCYPWLGLYTAHKMEDKSTPCIFIDYSPTQSKYLCLQLSTGRIYVSQHVRFDERTFPFKTSTLMQCIFCSLDLTSLMQSTISLSSCINLSKITGNYPNTYCDI